MPKQLANLLIALHAAFPVALVLLLVSPATAWNPLRNTPIVRAVQRARPAVVNIHGRKTLRSDSSLRPGDAFRQVNGMGTGVIIDERGYIITNYHVVEGVGRIKVTLADKQTLGARLIAHDPKTDLAIVKIDSNNALPVISIGTSSDLMPGETVVAVGNAYGYMHTVTEGIISALHRSVQVSDEQTYQDLIQTDASINPGNSGGPLLNINGDMIGINVAVRVGAQGIGFALPIDEALEVASRLLASRRLGGVAHGIVGTTRHSEDHCEYIVQRVHSGSVSARSGLQTGDVITRIGDVDVARSLDIERAFLGRRSGETLAMEVKRGGKPTSLSLTVGGSAAAPRVAKTASRDADTISRAWETLGVSVAAVTPRQYAMRDYSGGLRVNSIRQGSAAEKQGIRPGDILVGVHRWETVSLDNLAYVMSHEEFSSSQSLLFYIVRGGETYYVHLETPGAVNAHATYNKK